MHSNNRPLVSYKIKCKDCPDVYVGQTGRTFKKRSYEHLLCVKNADERSVIAMHSINNNHNFDFNNFQILDIEQNKFRREFSEMLNIYFHHNNINRKHDIFSLKNIYKNSIDIIK